MIYEEVKEKTDGEKIKAYLSVYKTAKDAEPAANTRKSSSKPEFKVVLSSGLDAVIERRLKNSAKQLVIMPSQKKYLFREGDLIQDIKTVSDKEFIGFFRDMEEPIAVNNVVFGKITSHSISPLYHFLISDQNREWMEKGYISFDFQQKSDVFNYAKELIKKKESLWKMIVTKSPVLNAEGKYNLLFIMMADLFDQYRGYDAARVFVENYTKSSIILCNSYSGYCYVHGYGSRASLDEGRKQLERIVKNKELETGRMIDYICYGMYAQGMRNVDLNMWDDYLLMKKDYEKFIEISENPEAAETVTKYKKYPDNLHTMHDVLTLKTTQMRGITDSIKFKEIVDDFEEGLKLNGIKIKKEDGFSVIYEDKDNAFVIPRAANDLIDEGVSLGHCVGTYVNHVINGECIIAFVRKRGNLDKSYLTVELRPWFVPGSKQSYSFCQIQGSGKRTRLTKDEEDFFNKLLKVTKYAWHH